MARRANDLKGNTQREKRNADSGGKDAAAAQMGYSDRLLAKNHRLNPPQLREIQEIIGRHYDELTDAWHEYFGH